MNAPSFNAMQTVKRRFFAMRNGIIADTLRKAGSPFRIIFGLNLPQIVEIANETGVSMQLAEDLWANNATRESMLIAPLIADKEAFTQADAERWIATIPAAEVADILCHKLLRYQSYAWELAEKIVADNTTLKELADSTPTRAEWGHYTAVRLAFNLLSQDPARALAIANTPNLSENAHSLAASLADEASFLLGNI